VGGLLTLWQAAGITSLIKTIMMLRERQIPPQPGWPFKLNHKFPDLAKANVRIPTKPTALVPSPKSDGKIKLVVNSFDASVKHQSLYSSLLFLRN
jgi:acyl transferase domain-containing protein